MRDEGVSAIEKFIPLFQDLLAFEHERNQTLKHPLYDGIDNKVPISVGVLRSGVWPSTVPETLVAEGRAGLMAGEAVEVFQQQMVDRIQAAAQRDPWLREHPTERWSGSAGSSHRPRHRSTRRSRRRSFARITG